MSALVSIDERIRLVEARLVARETGLPRRELFRDPQAPEDTK